MPTTRLTRKLLSAIEAGEKPVTYFDSELKGFGLLVRPSGVRSWIAEYRPGAGGRGVSKRRVVIGDPAIMTPEEARSAARELLARVRLGADPAAERAEERAAETFADVAETWFTEHVLAKRKPATARYYRGMLDIHVLPAIGTRRVAAVTRQDVARLHASVAGKASGPKKPGARRTPPLKVRGGKVAANRVLATVGAVYGWALGLGILPRDSVNPAKGIEPFKEAARERFLGDDEMRRLGAALRLAETEGLRWEPAPATPSDHLKHVPAEENRRVVVEPQVTAAIRLLLLTGCRLREVLHLEWSQVDWQRGFLVLPETKTGRRTVVLGAAALAVLENLPRIGRYVIAGKTAGSPGERPRSDLNRPWRAICRAAGIEGTRLHDLRHSNAAVGVGAGLSLYQVGGLLGHTQPRTTQRYAHLAADGQRRAADIVGGQIASALGIRAVTGAGSSSEARG